VRKSDFRIGFGGAGRRGGPAGREIGGIDLPEPDEYQPQVPTWLQHQDEVDAVDWGIVARHAALKPGMVPFLALAMNMRFRHELSREEAQALVSSFGLQGKIEAAYKWIEREDVTQIAPLLKMQNPPAPVAALAEHAPLLVRASLLASILSKVALSWSHDRYLPGDVEVNLSYPRGGETGLLADSRKEALEGLGVLIKEWLDGNDIFENGLLPPKMEQPQVPQRMPAIKPVHSPQKPFTPPWEALHRSTRPQLDRAPSIETGGIMRRNSECIPIVEWPDEPSIVVPQGLTLSWSKKRGQVVATVSEEKTGRTTSSIGANRSEVIEDLGWLVEDWTDGEDIFEDEAET
jgi:hypothetical protein